jgi:hypothetical protein
MNFRLRQTTLIVAKLLVLCASPTAAQQTPSDAIVFDSYVTPAAGSQNLLTVQHALASLEDWALPLKLGQERSRPGLALGILYRTGKFLGLDVPQDHMLMVIAHEVFGHGARLRELGSGRIRYGFDVPIPYGDGGAVTRFRGELPDTPLTFLAIEMAGIEAQHTLADAIAARALARGQLHYREAWLYFESRLTGMTYILTASAHSADGHDVADFLETFREACKGPACTPVTRRDVQRRALLTLADPLLYFSIYGFAASYVGQGQMASRIPMIPLGRDFQYLPSVRFQLTPYGTEWVFRNAFKRTSLTGPRAQGRGLTGVTLRIGATGASTPWGLDVSAPEFTLPLLRWRVKPAVSFWRQPSLNAQETSAPLETGFGVTAATVLALPRRFRSDWWNGVYVMGGYKSRGFVPGEQLYGGGFLRAGVTLVARPR